MRVYAAAPSAGILVGILYGCIGVRLPAPPVVALVGLFGILLGEQVVPPTNQWLAAGRIDMIGWVRSECVPHVFGELATNATLRVKTSEGPT
jgi:XapX domain-containing protein